MTAILAARIALFEALCEDIKEKAVRGELKVAHVCELRDDLIAISRQPLLPPFAKGLINQAYARADVVERYLNMEEPPHVSPMLRDAVSVLCETLGQLKAKLEPT